MSELIYARENPELIDTLLKRRSVSAKLLADPGPSPEQILSLIHI